MFEGRVNLIERRKLVHCGIKLWNGTEYIMTSVCSGVWELKDIVTEGDAKEVTCKRCRKIIDRADSDGHVKLK